MTVFFRCAISTQINFPTFSRNIFILHRNDICGSSAMTPDDEKAKALNEIHLLTGSIFKPTVPFNGAKAFLTRRPQNPRAR
jgi:hypothetical protein